jgi:hypothetical protein
MKKKETQGQIAARLGISRQALSSRLRNGWDPKKATTTPAKARNPRFEGKDTIRARCAKAGIPENTYYSRRLRGLSPREALK